MISEESKAASAGNGGPNSIPPHALPVLKWLTMLLYAWFGVRLVYFALSLSSFAPPDEVSHAGICLLFSKVLLLPDNSSESYRFGLVTNIPWLYYRVMGTLLHGNITGLPDLVYLRLLNLPLAFGTVWYSLRLAELLGGDRLVRILLLAVVTNLAMFSFLSASVSYDNLTNLLAAMAICHLFIFFRNRSPGDLAVSFICQLAGCLTKVTFLPLVLALGVLLFLFEWRNFSCVPQGVRRWFHASGRRAAIAAAVLCIGLGLNLQLYAGNYLRYGSLNPPLAAVVSPQAAMEHRLDARGMIFSQYKEGKITYMEALMLTGEMDHPGDKADTFFLLMNYEKLKQNPGLWLTPLQYLKVWYINMVASTVGIKSHLVMPKDPRYLVPFYGIMLLALAGMALCWRPGRDGWTAPALGGVALFYAGFVLYEFNYPAYQNYGAPGLTLYGRYLFPVLAPVGVLTCHYLLQLVRGTAARAGIALAVALLFIAADFPWFLTHVTPEWQQWLPGQR